MMPSCQCFARRSNQFSVKTKYDFGAHKIFSSLFNLISTVHGVVLAFFLCCPLTPLQATGTRCAHRAFYPRHPGTSPGQMKGENSCMQWSLLRPVGLVAAALVLTTVAASAEGGKSAGPSEFLLVAQIVLLIAVGRGLGEIMQRLGQ